MPRPQPLCWIDSQAPDASLLGEQLSLLGFDARLRSANDDAPLGNPMREGVNRQVIEEIQKPIDVVVRLMIPFVNRDQRVGHIDIA